MHPRYRTRRFPTLALAAWLLGLVFMVAGLSLGAIEHIGVQGDLFIVGLYIDLAGLPLVIM